MFLKEWELTICLNKNYSIMDNSKMGFLMEKVLLLIFYVPTDKFIKDNGRRERKREKGFINILKLKNMKVNGRTMRRMGMENISQVKEDIRVTGKTIKKMEKVV